jgi:hypothetical protein
MLNQKKLVFSLSSLFPKEPQLSLMQKMHIVKAWCQHGGRERDLDFSKLLGYGGKERNLLFF